MKKIRIPGLRPSTVEFFREGRRLRGYGWREWVHGYVYGRWTYLYIALGTGAHPLARRWGPGLGRLGRWLGRLGFRKARSSEPVPGTGVAEGYHGKVMPLEAATQLVQVNEDIRLTNLEKVVPYTRARDIILKNPDHLMALECPCRSARSEPCLPLDVCLIVGEPFTSFVAEHHGRKARWISPQEAVQILQAEDERGHVHHAFFKDAMLGRFYAICNCCPCCCGAIHAHKNGTPMLASSGYVIEVDADLCIGCGECVETCPFDALTLDITAIVSAEKCMGCGICGRVCAQAALGLVRAPGKGEPLEIFKLMGAAAQAGPRPDGGE